MHFMPWEVDYALESFTQLSRAKYFIPEGFEVHTRPVLNLSGHIIDWANTKIPKEHFIGKFTSFSRLLDTYHNQIDVYDGDSNYGHLDWQRNVYREDSDYYPHICPDIYFSEHLLGYMIGAAQNITTKYFVLTPQICTLWDSSWDVLVNTEIGSLPYQDWITKREISEIDNFLHTGDTPVVLRDIPTFKWAGWFDLCNREFIETVGTIPEDWSGYGGWDLYTMIISDSARRRGYDIKQYILDGQIVFPRECGVFVDSCGYTKYYRDFIEHKDLTDQRLNFNARMNESLNKKLSQL